MEISKEEHQKWHEEYPGPSAGIERKIIKLFSSGRPRTIMGLVHAVMKFGLSEQKAGHSIWHLVDKGHIKVSPDRKLRLCLCY